MTSAEKDIRCPLCVMPEDFEYPDDWKPPLLATYGFDEKGRLYVHIRSYKAKSVRSEVFIRGGEVTLKCPRCLKYNTVRIVSHKPVLDRARRPDISADNPPATSLQPTYQTP